MRLERLARWVQPHLDRARENERAPTWPMAVEMSQDLLLRVLNGEAEFWLAASRAPGLTEQQRVMRREVARFYREQHGAQARALGGGGP